MGNTPRDFKLRLNDLFRKPPEEGAVELDRMTTETLTIVKDVYPELDVETDVKKQAMKRRKAWDGPPATSAGD